MTGTHELRKDLTGRSKSWFTLFEKYHSDAQGTESPSTLISPEIKDRRYTGGVI